MNVWNIARQAPTLRQLEYFLAVAELGSFGLAAQHCGVSQPALSRQIKTVEELLGVELFERSRPVTLTEAGRQLISRSQQMLRLASELVETASAAGGGFTGELQLGVIPTVAPYFLPGLLAKMRRAFPELRLVLHEMQTDELVGAIATGELELALLALPIDSTLDGVEVAREPFVLATPPGHRLARPEAITTEDLRNERLILMGEGHCFRDHTLEVCKLASAEPETAVEAASLSTLVRLVESGFGATLVPVSALASEVQPGSEVVLRAFEEEAPSRILGLKWRSSAVRIELFLAIAELCRQHLADLNARLPDQAVHGPRTPLTPLP